MGVSLEVDQFKADNKTVTKEKKKEKYDKGITFKNLERMHGNTKANATLVHIHFKQLGLTKYARTESIHLVDVIAACGGIIGFGVGFSLLSGVELIYFFTLRMWVDHRRAKAKKRKVESSTPTAAH